MAWHYIQSCGVFMTLASRFPEFATDVDVSFDATTDTPPGRDPDSYSATLRQYHLLLWTKPLPDGTPFTLVSDAPGTYLLHESAHGRFALASDSIINDNEGLLAGFYTERSLPAINAAKGPRWAWTIAQCILFPGNRVENKPTVNGARGMHPRIRDRFDLTLECIRRHYAGDQSPLSAALGRYSDFFALFTDFRGYVDFFLLEDLVEDASAVRFYLPFDDFHGPALPQDFDAYLEFLRAQASFERRRAERMQRYIDRVGNG